MNCEWQLNRVQEIPPLPAPYLGKYVSVYPFPCFLCVSLKKEIWEIRQDFWLSSVSKHKIRGSLKSHNSIAFSTLCTLGSACSIFIIHFLFVLAFPLYDPKGPIYLFVLAFVIYFLQDYKIMPSCSTQLCRITIHMRVTPVFAPRLRLTKGRPPLLVQVSHTLSYLPLFNPSPISEPGRAVIYLWAMLSSFF